MTKFVDITGTIETQSERWMIKFMEWLKSRNEVFLGGSIHERGSNVAYIGTGPKYCVFTRRRTES